MTHVQNQLGGEDWNFTYVLAWEEISQRDHRVDGSEACCNTLSYDEGQTKQELYSRAQEERRRQIRVNIEHSWSDKNNAQLEKDNNQSIISQESGWKAIWY